MRSLIRLILVLGVPLLVASIVFLLMRAAFLAPRDSGDTKFRLVEIEPDKSFRDICVKIKEAGVVRYAWALEILSRMKRSDTGINAGEYELSPSMSPKEILAKLSSGAVLKRKVTVVEGMSAWEIGSAVEAAGLLPKDQFDAGIADATLLAVAGLSTSSFEGYLYPETYYFSRPITPKTIIFSMLEQGDKVWPAEFTHRADEITMSRHEILTLASIIQKEAGNEEEMPLISSVFHNRLTQGMRLQADPTVIYGIKDFNGNLTKEDLQTPHPYNTYVNFGLPPGPICNPGLAAIRAALYPRESSYLFFVASGNGNHVFSTTLQEHNEAVRLYLQKQKADQAEKEAAALPVPSPGPVKSAP